MLLMTLLLCLQQNLIPALIGRLQAMLLLHRLPCHLRRSRRHEPPRPWQQLAMRKFYQDGGVAASEVSVIEQDRDEDEVLMEIEEKVEEEVEEKTSDHVQTEEKEEEKVDPWVSFEQSFLEEEVVEEEKKKTNDDTVLEEEENVKVVTMSRRVLDILVSVRASEKLTVPKLCEEASELRQYTIKDWTDTLKFLVVEEEESLG